MELAPIRWSQLFAGSQGNVGEKISTSLSMWPSLPLPVGRASYLFLTLSILVRGKIGYLRIGQISQALLFPQWHGSLSPQASDSMCFSQLACRVRKARQLAPELSRLVFYESRIQLLRVSLPARERRKLESAELFLASFAVREESIRSSEGSGIYIKVSLYKVFSNQDYPDVSNHAGIEQMIQLPS